MSPKQHQQQLGGAPTNISNLLITQNIQKSQENILGKNIRKKY